MADENPLIALARQRRLRRTILALLCGVLVASLGFSLSLGAPALLNTTYVETYGLLSVVGSILKLAGLIALIGVVPAIIFGLPLHAMLYRLKQRNLFVYALGGSAAGWVGYGLFARENLTVELSMASVLMGAAGASVAWLIRRPDKDAQQAPREAHASIDSNPTST
jgi:hypothetical protein